MMTDPKARGHGLPSAQAVPRALGPAAPRRRMRWVAFALMAVVVLGLTAGLVLWAPWVPPPVLRPTGLVTGPSTANSVSFHWSRPRTGPLPDKYLILGNGAVAGSAAGTVTAFRQAGLTPAVSYQYRVVAVRGGTRSPQSALLTVRTLTPPISEARLQGPWNVQAKPIHHRLVGLYSYAMIWQVTPGCPAGACDAKVYVENGKHPFSVKLARAGAVYRGQAVLGFTICGPRGNSIPDPTTLKIRLRVTAATGQGQVWAATSLAGTVTGTTQYVSSAAFYCPASGYRGSLAGSSAS